MGDKATRRMNRRVVVGLLAASTPLSAGCMSPWFRGTSPEDEMQQRREEIRAELEKTPRLIAEIAYDRELTLTALENVGLVTRLSGTGGPVKPSQPRDRMIDMMRRNDVKDPNQVLDRDSTTMVIAAVAIPPGARKGTKLDVLIDCSKYSEATDLANGWLLETPLMSMSKLGGTIRRGFKSANGGGQIVTFAQVSGSEEPADKLRGSVVGGATFIKERSVGIAVQAEFADAITMAALVKPINERFTYFDGRGHVGVGTPTRDDYIKLQIPNRYRLDPYHFVNVVLNLGFNESAMQRTARMQALAPQLEDSSMVQRACWQLEAMGEGAASTLALGLGSPKPDVRFFSAHSLAYLDNPAAIPPLTQLCVQEPAFRAMCLNALAITDHFQADEALRGLLHSADAESRYGAVRALRVRDSRDPQVTATQIGDAGGLLEIPSESPPLIAVSLTEVPEVVIFGNNPMVTLPKSTTISPYMSIHSEGNGRYVVSNSLPRRDRQAASADADLRSLLTAIASVGGNYGDWVSFVRLSSQNSYIAEPIAFNPVPTAGREYVRESGVEEVSDDHLMGETIINDLVDEPEVESKASWLNPTTWWSE